MMMAMIKFIMCVRVMDGWVVYCIINGLTITMLWVNDDEHD